MSDHAYVPEDNNAALEALKAIGSVFVPFAFAVAMGLYFLGGIGQPDDGHHEADHGEEAAH